MKYYMGLDVGATKTFCLIADETAAIRGFGRAGNGSYEVQGIAAAARENQQAVRNALDAAGLTLADIAWVGMGVAGADLPEDFVMLEREIYTPLFGSTPRVFRNDSMAAMRGSVRTSYGIVIACGTGVIAAGINPQGQEARAGGLNEEFGDLWTGTIIGRQGLYAVYHARDGVRPPTLLTDLFVEKAGCSDVDEFFYKMYRREMSMDALQPMARLVFDAAFQGDSAALEILRAAGGYLGELVIAVARKLEMSRQPFDLVTAGSVFKGSSPVLKDCMMARVHEVCPLAKAVTPLFEPVVGALFMALEKDVDMTDSIYENLADSLLEAGKQSNVEFTAK
ncbi:MAG TPA: BadF/BadG/BcrA/BcrD ATPase family protein [Candidatus Hydrogenedentes bacterium]|jgi:N-acetylglucosamine kinase-like BadF-type ATPase|nr:BadF/BadG/BcrA/BcrD ATPase family protein [Candidatus Hydrogenedentota bacterium]HPJ98990.1 BadF/BadG/BcrA/BcrD ATPase family protein [Candidatus Hydrogenedentota bacterium]